MYKKYKPHFRQNEGIDKTVGVIKDGTWKEILYCESNENLIKGNHYHKETTKLIYIIKGEMEITLQQIEEGGIIADAESITLKNNETIIIQPRVNYIIQMTKPTNWLTAYDKPIDKDNPDIIRMMDSHDRDYLEDIF